MMKQLEHNSLTTDELNKLKNSFYIKLVTKVSPILIVIIFMVPAKILMGSVRGPNKI